MHAHIHAATSGRGMGGRVDSQRKHGGECGGRAYTVRVLSCSRGIEMKGMSPLHASASMGLAAAGPARPMEISIASAILWHPHGNSLWTVSTETISLYNDVFTETFIARN